MARFDRLCSEDDEDVGLYESERECRAKLFEWVGRINPGSPSG